MQSIKTSDALGLIEWSRIAVPARDESLQDETYLPQEGCAEFRHQAELAVADMVADTERLGLYDVDPADVAAALRAARREPKARPRTGSPSDTRGGVYF